VQVNGKRRGEISAPAGAEPAEVEKIVLADPGRSGPLEGLTVRKVIVVKDRIVNIVAADDDAAFLTGALPRIAGRPGLSAAASRRSTRRRAGSSGSPRSRR
jgi:hypothetical protein